MHGRRRPRAGTPVIVACSFLCCVLITWLILSSTSIKQILSPSDPVCIIVRVSAPSSGNLSEAIVSYRRLNNQNWRAVISVTGPTTEVKELVDSIGDSRITLNWPTDEQARTMLLEGTNDDGSIEECQKRVPDLRWLIYLTASHRLNAAAFSALDHNADLIQLLADERPATLAHQPCERLGCVSDAKRLVAPVSAHLVSFSRLKKERRLSAYALAAKQQQLSWLTDVQREGWRLVKASECVHMQDAPGYCWQHGGVWFDSPYEHERRCHETAFINDLVRRNASVLDVASYTVSAVSETRCLRYRQNMKV